MNQDVRTPLHDKVIEAWARTIDQLRSTHGEQSRDVIFEDIESYSHDGKTIWFGQNVRALYDPLLSSVLKRWGDRISTNHLETELRQLVLDEDPATNTIDKVKVFAATLDAEDPHYRAVIPLNGIVLQAPLTVSNSVQLAVMSDELFDQLIGTTVEHVLTVNEQVQDWQKTQQQDHVHRIKDFLRGHPCIIVELPMDEEKILELLVEDDEQSGEGLPIVDFLQFCVGVISPRYQHSIVDWRFRYRSEGLMVPYPTASLGGDHFRLIFKRGGNAPYTLTSHNLEELRKLSVLDVVHLFDGIASRNDYDELLYLAIRAFAEGEREQSLRARLLHYTTAFELFFSEARETVRSVSEGVAYLWTNDAADRAAVAKYVVNLYTARSKSSHGGHRTRDVRGARHIALSIILMMIQRRSSFKTKRGLQDWLTFQRFSSAPDAGTQVQTPGQPAMDSGTT